MNNQQQENKQNDNVVNWEKAGNYILSKSKDGLKSLTNNIIVTTFASYMAGIYIFPKINDYISRRTGLPDYRIDNRFWSPLGVLSVALIGQKIIHIVVEIDKARNDSSYKLNYGDPLTNGILYGSSLALFNFRNT